MDNGSRLWVPWIPDPTTLRSGSRNGQTDDYVQSNMRERNLRAAHLTYTEQNGLDRI